jgi:hypothetical protein
MSTKYSSATAITSSFQLRKFSIQYGERFNPFFTKYMSMNFASLDCPCQGASSEPKKIYLDFSVLEKIAKNKKIHIFGSHSKKWVQWLELLLYLNSTHSIQ